MNKTNIERYAQLCRQELHTFLGGELMRCDPSDMDDPEIILEADARSRRWTLEGTGYLSRSAQFCSLMAVDGEATVVYENIYDQRYVDVLRLHPMNLAGRFLDIPFNHFQYPMMTDTGRREAFDEGRASLVCTFEDMHDREKILAGCSGLVLYSYHLGGITKFGQHRNLYRLSAFTRETLADVIRRELVKAQCAVMDTLARYPEFCKPDIDGHYITLEQANIEMLKAVEERREEIDEKRQEATRRAVSGHIKTERI